MESSNHQCVKFSSVWVQMVLISKWNSRTYKKRLHGLLQRSRDICSLKAFWYEAFLKSVCVSAPIKFILPLLHSLYSLLLLHNSCGTIIILVMCTLEAHCLFIFLISLPFLLTLPAGLLLLLLMLCMIWFFSFLPSSMRISNMGGPYTCNPFRRLCTHNNKKE